MTLLAIDFGGSGTDVVWGENPNELARKSFPALDFPATTDSVNRIIDHLPVPPRTIVVTGGKSRQLPEQIAGIPLHCLGEIEAVGWAGRLFSPMPTLVVSLGTGTAMVKVTDNAIEHIGGTGVGGGTLVGLSRLLIGQALGFGQLETLAKEGDTKALDLSVGDIVGGDLGWLKADYVAANFGKAARGNLTKSQADLVAATFHLIGHTVSSLSLHLARAHDLPRILVIGHPIDSPLMQEIFASSGSAIGGKFDFPPQPRYGVASGAFFAHFSTQTEARNEQQDSTSASEKKGGAQDHGPDVL